MEAQTQTPITAPKTRKQNGKDPAPRSGVAISFFPGFVHEMAETGFSNISHIQNANMSGKHKSHKCFVPPTQQPRREVRGFAVMGVR